MTKFCGKCGSENIDQDVFCVKCGYRLNGKDTLYDFQERMSDPSPSPNTTPIQNRSPNTMSLENAKNLGKICGAITAIVSIVFIFLWKFDITVTQSISGITTSHQQMSFIDLMSIEPGSILGLLVIAIIIISILSILNPMISMLNPLLCIIGFWQLVGTGVVKHGTFLDYTYQIKMGSTADMFVGYAIVCILLMVFFLALYYVPRMMYSKNPEYKGKKDALLMFWK